MSSELKTQASKQSLLRIDTGVGMLARVSLFLLLMSLVFASVFAVNALYLHVVSGKVLTAMFLVVIVPMTVGMICFELPRGADWILFRIGMATFCRTGLPLLIVMLVGYFSDTGLVESAFGVVVFFYLVGLMASMWISIKRFSEPKSTGEVDRAVA